MSVHTQCCYCHRDVATILSWAMREGEINKKKSNKRGNISLLYVDADNHLICERCASKTNKGYNHGGEPVYIYNQERGKRQADMKKIDAADHTLVDDSGDRY